MFKKRRVIIKIMMAFLAPCVLTNYQVQCQDLNVIKSNNWKTTWRLYSDISDPLYHYLAKEACKILEVRTEKLKHIQTIEDWVKHQKRAKQTLLNIVGPFPKKTPLNAKISKTVYKQGYKVEQITYESQPGLYVTSSLFIPGGQKDKVPTIIYCSGHATDRYRGKVYQHEILNLVKKGFIVFAFDPVGQGERIQYFDSTNRKSIIGGPTIEHLYSGTQAFITGSSQARYMIWDGIRAIDYLFSRKEVDTNRIGITGRSGGGTQSAYIAAFDDRIKAVASGNYISSLTRLLQSMGPADAEQNFFNGIARGIDHADLLEVRAPKPALMITTTNDFFSIQGARETAKEVYKMYQAYDKKANFAMVEDDAFHASTKKNREAMYAFFQKFLNNPGDSDDEETESLRSGELQVTRTGQVLSSLGGETVFSLNRKEAEKLINKRQISRKSLGLNLSAVISSAKTLSGYQEKRETVKPIFTGRFQRDGCVVEKYFIKGEGDYPIPYLFMKPNKPNRKALLYLNPTGKLAEALPGGEIEWFVKNGFTVIAPDLIGMGEMNSDDNKLDTYIDNETFDNWLVSMLIGRSIVGIQTRDLISLVHLLDNDTLIDEIYGLAKKQAAPILLHAAAFDSTITRIALIEPYSSYRSIVMDMYYNPSFINSTVPGALGAYDLPDLAASLAPRNLIMIGTTNGLGKVNDLGIQKDIEEIRVSYYKQNAVEKLKIVPFESIEKTKDIILKWLE